MLQNGEENGLVIELNSSKHNVVIDFGVTVAVRILDEGIVLNNLFDNEQVEDFRIAGFDNTIYQIKHGEFDDFFKLIGGELHELLDFKHYVIISENFIVEVMAEWQPTVEVFSI